MVNSFAFTRTIFDAESFLEATHNQFKVVSVRSYTDKKGILPNGYNLTLLILKDDYDYGVDKDGNMRENNEYQNFDVTILTDKKTVKKGDIVKLLDFDSEHSYVIKYELILRFKDFEVLKTAKSTN